MAIPIRACAVLAAANALVAALAIGEWLTWRASIDLIDSCRRDPGDVQPGEVVLVLGYRSRANGSASAMQRWRTRIAVRSTDPTVGRFLFSGGATTGDRSEATVMAEYAVDHLCVPRSAIDLEQAATTTWENIAFTLPQLKQATRVKIASNTFHSRRARRYVVRQDPDLAARLHRARDYRLGEWSAIKLLLLAYEWRRLLVERHRSSARASAA